MQKIFGDKVSNSDMISSSSVDLGDRSATVERKLEQFASAELVITDRLHGMIFAAIAGTSCIVVNSKSPKVRGCYEWIRHLPYIRFAESAADVEVLLPQLLAMKDCKFDNTPLLPYFDQLAEVVREYASN